MKYLTRVRWGGGSLQKIPFFKGHKMHKPITLIFFVPVRDKVFRALPPLLPRLQCTNAHTGQVCPQSTAPTLLQPSSNLPWLHPARKWDTASSPAQKSYHNPAWPSCTYSLPTGSPDPLSLSPVKEMSPGTYFQHVVLSPCITEPCPSLFEIISLPLPSHPWWHIKILPMHSILSVISPPPRHLPSTPVRAPLKAHGHAGFCPGSSPLSGWVSWELGTRSAQLVSPTKHYAST